MKAYDNAVIYGNAMHEYDAGMIFLFSMP